MFTILLLATTATNFEISLHLHPTATFDTLDALFWKVSTPGSQSYLHFYRTPAELAPLFGGTSAAVSEATDYLKSLNGTGIRVSALRDRVTATFDNAVAANKHAWSARGLPLRPKPAGVHLVTRREDNLIAPSFPPHHHVGESPRASYTVANQKKAYKIPSDHAATNPSSLQMVWGPGTFGYSPRGLEQFRDEQCPGINTDKVHFDTTHHGQEGGDNFGEGTLDTHMISAFGMNVSTLVSNTNTSISTEEGDGFGLAFLDFVTDLASRDVVPHVLSLSLGSLSAYSCDMLCAEAVKTGEVTLSDCNAFLQKQRQVCMFISQAQVERINLGLMALGLRGVSVLGSSGDGGSHWSFGEFHGFGKIPRLLNKIGCEFQFPIFPSPSPYMISVGGTEWKPRPFQPYHPVMWEGFGGGSGGGFAWQFKRPDHQAEAVDHYLSTTSGLPPSSSFNATGRGYPDISAIAVDGTSQSSPVFAGIFSLIMDYRLNKGLKPLGPLGPRIYKVAKSFPGEAFEDVTEGNSKTSCDNGFPAAKGWDPTTGWGRPVWPGLVKHFGED